MAHPFDNLNSLSRQELLLWNWYGRCSLGGAEWRKWITEIFARLMERPAGQQIQLMQTHLVDAQFGERLLTFGAKWELFMGRDPENDVPLTNKAISNKHARLYAKDGRFYLEDLGGGLGTYLWDKKMRPNERHQVRSGDQFTIFPYRFRVQVENTWVPETEVAVGDFRTQPATRAEFLQASPPLWRTFVVNAQTGGERALLEISPSLLTGFQQRIFGASGVAKVKDSVPADDTLMGFVMLALLERLNERVKFPLQFSFLKSNREKGDPGRGISISFGIGVSGMAGHCRVFVPFDFLSSQAGKPTLSSGFKGPAELSWMLPVSAGFVDLTRDEISQVGLGDILVAERGAALLFPDDFRKGWRGSAEGSNFIGLKVDKYFERAISLEAKDVAGEVSRPALEALPLRLHVIVGEKEMTFAEIESLSPGAIVDLGSSKFSPVKLMVNGKVLGEGELVDVEGNLAVKVLRWRSL
jgi:flagellar motor switch/type III secretory pathway protein FliN/pSer/pThr/pTyr-binding forkhead associated (FHA) protein